MTSSSAAGEQRDLVLEIDRTFRAPRELIWRLWQDPEHMVRWHGPEGFALTACEIDFRVGGKWRRCMSKGPGHAHWIHGEYLEIIEPSRLSFSYINDYDGVETVVTMTFSEPEPGHTRMQFRQTLFIGREERDGHGWGWNSGFDLLDRYLAQFTNDDWRPRGQPRIDGVAEDVAAARRRHEEEKHADTAHAGRTAGAELSRRS